MILDHLDNGDRYLALHPGFGDALAFLRGMCYEALEAGRCELQGDRLFALIGRDPGRGRGGAQLEAHRKYIDIQLAVAGAEEIGWKPLQKCSQVVTPYDDARDIMLFGDEPDAWINLAPRHFMIFFPSDAHAPLAGQGPLHKAVVKVAVDFNR